MSVAGSVTVWIEQLQRGEEAALAKLHQRYWPCLVAQARKRLAGVPSRAADEEDIAQEALWSFYRRVKAGRQFRLASRHDLLALLTHIIACKAVNRIEHELGVQKRGGGRIRSENALAAAGSESPAAILELAQSAEPTPLEQALLNDCYRHYVSSLKPGLRPFAELYLSGFTHLEIAARMGCVERTVERKLALVLDKWQEIGEESVRQEMPIPVDSR